MAKFLAQPWLSWIGLSLVLMGCEKRQDAAPPARLKPNVHVVRPESRTIERIVSQPAFINAFEQTSIFPKISGYIQAWTVDIGDRIKKDQVMAELFVPELEAEYQQKQAIAAEQEVLDLGRRRGGARRRKSFERGHRG